MIAYLRDRDKKVIKIFDIPNDLLTTPKVILDGAVPAVYKLDDTGNGYYYDETDYWNTAESVLDK